MPRPFPTRWLPDRSNLRRKPAAAPRPRIRLEPLEDRVTPATADFGSLHVDPNSYDPTHVLVRLRPDVADPAALQLPAGATLERPLSLVPGLWEVSLAPGVSVTDTVAAFQSSPFVVSATPNYMMHVGQIPNDPQFASQWGLNNTGQTGGTPDADIDAPEAWNVTTGSRSVIVAVLDTGVDYTHPDLAPNMWHNPGEIPGNGIDDDGNGFVDDVYGYDFANNDSDPMDDHEHGTHVAGIIAAAGNNNIGVTGVAWNVQIMAVKFLDASGNGTTADAIRALNYAVQNGATISNNSYAGDTSADADPLFLEAIRNAASAGHIFVAGAGNNGTDNDSHGFYPAAFDADNIISVAATDANDQLASFSNYGATTVDLAAPGVDILSTLPGGQYGTLSGTSMATPFVTGSVALVRSLHPDWTYQQVIDDILNSVDYLPGLDGRTVTGGRLNVARALSDTDGPHVVATDPSGGVGGVVSSLRVTFNESIDPASFDTSDVTFTGPDGPIALTGVTPVDGSRNRKFDVSFASQITHGTYRMVIGPAITDLAGNAMDQDGDGVLGEPTDDQYTATFVLGDQYVFHSTDTPKSLTGFSTTSSYLTVDPDLSIADLDVQINVSSPDVGYDGITLVSPTGTQISLAPMTGTSRGPTYQDTVFNDEAATTLDAGSSPYTGSFQPASPLSAVDDQSTHGTWHLDVLNLFGGTINSWSLMVVANPPRLSVDDVSVAEGNDGTTLATFTVRMSNVIDQPVTVDYATADGTATAGSDYTATSGTLTFNPGELTKTITVAVQGDTLDEPDETFFLNLSNPVNATLADGQAVGTILNDEESVAINDVSVKEGDGGSVNALFTVSLSKPSTHSVTVQYATAPGTATAGVDYTTTSGTLTFNPGETTKTVVVAVKGDTRYEREETFFVNLTATDALLADGQGVGTILNDDPVPVMTVNDVSLTEGDSGTRNLNFNVILNVPSDDPVSVDYATADGTATAGSDYAATTGTLTFAPGQTVRSVTVPLTSDTALEPDETLYLNLSNPVNAILMDGQAVGTVLNDDLGITIDDVTVPEGDAGSFPVTFTARLSAPAPFEVRVNYATANGTAGAATDYVAASGTLVFAPGETAKTVTVLGIADRLNEADETFYVNLSGAVNAAITDNRGQATILDDDPVPSISIADAAITEGSSGTRNLTFVATLSAPSGQNVTFNYTTADGTATAGSDYQPASGTLNFGAGSTTRAFNIALTTDNTPEPDETFFFNLSGATNATIADGQAVGTILDDDSLTVDDVRVAEGDDGTSDSVFTVHLLAPRDQPVTVNYATANGTAAAGSDYLPASGTLTFLPGQTVQTVAVPVIGDRFSESDETFFLNLSNAVGAGIGDGQGVATITNDDPLPTVSVSDVAVSEGNSGSKNAVFTLTLSQASGQNVSVNYATADGTATAGSDYQPRSGTVTFGPGATTVAVNVPVMGDTIGEGNETFSLNLSGVTNGVLADSQATGLIYDDDPLPAVSVSDATATEGNSGTKTYFFYVTLSAASTQTVTVQFATADGTATAGSDYAATSTLVTFAPGQTSKTVAVTVYGDTAVEPTETFSALLSAPTNAVLGDASGVGTIQNDDTTLRVNDVTVAEGDDGTTAAVFTVSLAGPQPQDEVRVNYTTSNSSAIAGSDYVATSGTLVFAPGQTTQTVTVLVLGDRVDENPETFTLNLARATNAVIADSQGVATIVDPSDPPPTVSIADASIAEGASGTRTLTFVARLSAPSGKTVTVNYATQDGTATAGSDYLTRTGTLNFGPGGLVQTVNVPINGDTTPEQDETFFVNLSGAVNATVADGQAVGTILDDDSLSVDDVTATEGDAGTTVAQFTVHLLAPRDQPVSVSYATANGTAIGGVDYLPTAGTLTFAPGETAKTVSVEVVGDRLNEAGETFFLNLSNAAGALLADNQGRATIADDDAPPSITISDGLLVAEGNTGTRAVNFTVTLSQPSGQNVTVVYATQDGTATAGSDYQAKTGTLTIGAGQTTATISVLVNGDTAVEPNETFFLSLSSPVNATIATGRGMATIFDDEVLPGGVGTVSITDTPPGTGDAGTPPTPPTGGGDERPTGTPAAGREGRGSGFGSWSFAPAGSSFAGPGSRGAGTPAAGGDPHLAWLAGVPFFAGQPGSPPDAGSLPPSASPPRTETDPEMPVLLGVQLGRPTSPTVGSRPALGSTGHGSEPAADEFDLFVRL